MKENKQLIYCAFPLSAQSALQFRPGFFPTIVCSLTFPDGCKNLTLGHLQKKTCRCLK